MTHIDDKLVIVSLSESSSSVTTGTSKLIVQYCINNMHVIKLMALADNRLSPGGIFRFIGTVSIL